MYYEKRDLYPELKRTAFNTNILIPIYHFQWSYLYIRQPLNSVIKFSMQLHINEIYGKRQMKVLLLPTPH